MALKVSIKTGVTGSGATKWYALYTQRSTGKMADTTNNTWDTIVAGDLADYSSFLSEVSTSGVYEATVPAFVESAALTEPIDVVILATAAGTEAWTDGALGKPRFEGTLCENANVVGISGDSTAADNAESFFDGTGYAGTGNVIPTVTTVTNTVNANTVQISGDTTAADNAESFFDGTGYAGTNNVIPLVTTTTTATNVTTVNGLAAGVITATSIASDAITAAKIAADAIGASELAADAVTEIAAAISIPSAATIADAVWDEARSGHVSAGTFGEGVLTQSVNSGGIASTSFATGAITATAIAADAIGASELAADAVSEIAAAISIPSAATIADAVWDEAQSGHVSAGTFGIYLDTTVSSRLATAGYTTPPTVGAIADQVWDEVRSGHTTAGTFGAGITMANASSGSIAASSFATGALDANALAADAVAEIAAAISIPSAASVADAVWDEATSGHTTSGTFGEQLKTDVDSILDDTGTAGVVVNTFTTPGKADLQQEATDALNAYDPPTRAEATSDANSIIAYVDLIDDGTSGLAKIATDVAAILVDTGTTLDAFIQAVKAKTDNLPASPAAVGSAMTLTSAERNSVADATLNRAASNIESTADKHSLGAVVMIATNASVSGTTLTAKKPSDDTTFQTYTVTVDAAADPITGVS